MRSAHFERTQFFLDVAGCSDSPCIVNIICHQKKTPFSPDNVRDGAWPFLLGGATCLVHFVNERDLSLPTSVKRILFFEGLFLSQAMTSEAKSWL